MQSTAPAFCPATRCEAHHRSPRLRWWVRDGTYSSRLHSRIQRYRCKLCGRKFSTQTFDIDYYAKQRVDYRLLVRMVGSCCGVRQVARALGIGYGAVTNRTMRFARQALAAQSLVIDETALREDLCADGLQSYWVNQYVPNNITVLVGSESRFVYAAVGASLRRSGRMTAAQQKRREILERAFRADPAAVTHSFTEICDVACRMIWRSNRRLTLLDTDEHLAYRRALRSHAPWHVLRSAGRVAHRRTYSTLPRTQSNPLASVNSIDRQIRIDLAEHVRETVRFARNPNRSMERFWVWCFSYNFQKRFRINQPASDTTRHWEVAAIKATTIRTAHRGIWRHRRFLSHVQPVGALLIVWLRMLERPYRSDPDYLPRYLVA